MTTSPSARFRVAVGRDLGTVVVAVSGDLDGPGAGHLGHVLADLVDGQGNLAVVVDLGDAGAADAGAAAMLAAVAERAGRRGGALHLRDPAGLLHQALQPRGLGPRAGDIRDNDIRHVGPRSPRPRSQADHPAGGARNLTPQHKGA